jgi:hypothetical protein
MVEGNPMIDWIKLADPNDGTYRADVLNTISRTSAGRQFLADQVRSIEDLSPIDRLIVEAQLFVREQQKPSVSAFPLFAVVGGAIARGAASFIPLAKVALPKVGTALTGAWLAFRGAATAKQIALGISAVFATDYLISKLQGQKPEVVKLYQAGREATGTTLQTTTQLISLLPLALVAIGIYVFTKGRR